MRNNKSFKLSEPKYKKLKAFTMHGLHINNISGNQAVSDCVFCGKEARFYINYKKLLWDCKACGKSGNMFKFLNYMNKCYQKNLSDKEIKILAKDRKLPVSAFKNWKIGYGTGVYSFPVYDDQNKLKDIRLYRLGGRVISTSQTSTGLFGLPKMLANKKDPIFICEGEWDALAMQWLLNKVNKPGVTISAPGANTFKVAWSDYFKGREVVVCYDNDKAGEAGQKLLLERLNGIVSSISFIRWPDNKPDGFDLRDFIVKEAIKRKKPRKSYKMLEEFLHDTPNNYDLDQPEILVKKSPEVDPSIDFSDVVRAYQDIMHGPSVDAIELCLISVISNLFPTDPLWYFLVAPASSGKTEIINGFKYLFQPYDDLAYFSSKLTPHTLISGMSTKKGDPSLLKKFENNPMALFIKDFTNIIAMRESDKDEVYSQFRDAYDGYSSKDFGNGVERRYDNLNFSIIAGCTYEIYNEASSFQALGERFGKLIITPDQSLENMHKMMNKAGDNVGKEDVSRDKVARIVYSLVKNIVARLEENERTMSLATDELKEAIKYVAFYSSAMRGSIPRDKFKRDYIKSKPTVESPIRFYKMLLATAIFRAMLHGRDQADMQDLILVKKIALDTVNQRDEEILRRVFILNKDPEGIPTRREILIGNVYTPYTVKCVLEDMVMTNVLYTEKCGRKDYYRLSKDMVEIIKKSHLYTTSMELNRKNIACVVFEKRKKLKLRLKKKPTK